MKNGRMQLKDIPDLVFLEVAAASHKTILRTGSTAPFTCDALVERYGNTKLVYLKVVQLANKGLLEYGVSPRAAWPTREGYQRLRAAGISA